MTELRRSPSGKNVNVGGSPVGYDRIRGELEFTTTVSPFLIPRNQDVDDDPVTVTMPTSFEAGDGILISWSITINYDPAGVAAPSEASMDFGIAISYDGGVEWYALLQTVDAIGVAGTTEDPNSLRKQFSGSILFVPEAADLGEDPPIVAMLASSTTVPADPSLPSINMEPDEGCTWLICAHVGAASIFQEAPVTTAGPITPAAPPWQS